jgi:ABC-type transporter Mla MlaB component
MDNNFTHSISGNKFTLEMKSHRFTQDLIHSIASEHPYTKLKEFATVEFNLEQVKMIDSSSLGYLFELHNKLISEEQKCCLVISVGNNHELKDLLHRFQVDLLLNVQ